MRTLPGTASGRRTSRSLWALLALVALAVPGCLLFTNLTPADDEILECFVTVRHAEQTADDGSFLEQDLASRGQPFLNADGTPTRVHLLGTDCPASFASAQTAATDFGQQARARIAELSDAGGEDDVFGRFPGSWCAVPGTLRCEGTGSNVAFCQDVPPLSTLSGPTLENCAEAEPDPDPGGPCLAVACDGESTCESHDFGEIGVGQRATTLVRLSHCGENGDAALEVAVPGLVDATAQLADFTIPVEANECHPLVGDGEVVTLQPAEACTFAVEFIPDAVDAHAGETFFASNTQPELHRLALSGVGLAGALTWSVADLPQLGGELCFDGSADPCTEARTLIATNAGPGAITLSHIRIETPPQNGLPAFEVDPTVVPGEDEPLVLFEGESAELAVRWCDNGPGSFVQSGLAVDSDDPQQPTFQLLLGRTDGQCPDGT